MVKGQRRLKIESTVLRHKTTSVPMERLAHVRLISPMSLMKSCSKQNDKNVLTLDGAIWEAVVMDKPGSTCYKRLFIIGLFDLSMNQPYQSIPICSVTLVSRSQAAASTAAKRNATRQISSVYPPQPVV